MGTKSNTDFLFASPSFASGTARLLDWFGDFDEYNTSPSSKEADSQAIASDWAMVGEDIRKAIGDFERTL